MEDESVVSALLDVTQQPTKPVYALADPQPLVLWDCEFDEQAVTWKYDPDSTEPLLQHWADCWERDTVAATLAAQMSTQLLAAYHGDTCAPHMASGIGNPAQLVAARSRMTCRGPADVPLLSRPRELSFEAKLAAMKGGKKRRREDNLAKGAATAP